MAQRWVRTVAVEEPCTALQVVDAGTRWIFLWCAGAGRKNTRSWEAADAEKHEALIYAEQSLVGSQERERLARKAQRKGRTKTVVQAERWADAQGQELVVFWEGGPYLLPEREEPEVVGTWV